MKIAIVLPQGYPSLSPPEFLAQIYALVRDEGEVEVFDFSNDYPKVIQKLFDSYPTINVILNSKKELLRRIAIGPPWTKVLSRVMLDIVEPARSKIKSKGRFKRLKKFSPDVLLFSLPTFLNYPSFCGLVESYKEYKPSSKVICGGYFASTFSKELMEDNPFIDFICKGEAEGMIDKLIITIKNGKGFERVPNILLRKKNKVLETERIFVAKNLDDFPLPDYSWIGNRYVSKAFTVTTSRGCVNNCIFCLHKGFYSFYRERSVKRVAEHINELTQRYGARWIYFSDLLLNPYPNRLEKLCSELIKIGNNVSWSGQIQPRFITKKTAKLMKESGVSMIGLGLECASHRVLKLMRKKSDDGEKILLNLKGAGIDSKTYWLLGFPKEKRSEIIETIKMVLNLLNKGLIKEVMITRELFIIDDNIELLNWINPKRELFEFSDFRKCNYKTISKVWIAPWHERGKLYVRKVKLPKKDEFSEVAYNLEHFISSSNIKNQLISRLISGFYKKRYYKSILVLKEFEKEALLKKELNLRK